ncbi:TMAO reductase system periplasmic protein TorT [Desulforhopalus singaporensis]|uniref:Protein TorT n=1 Tax=Desulforhopalus singaporensis TaxID=91360 RepID=A0A1H0U2B9_9BACT|nr:TMAO reductase system periplasmic protein TorT [Desulforhopalus singaporensis]SDP60118.1 protein TorT [Desulforhopalus singaporensis]
MQKKPIAITTIFLLILWSCLHTGRASGNTRIRSYYGTYDAAARTESSFSAGLQGPVTEEWQPWHPAKNYHVGVLFPHIKDSYFSTANYGIVSHARKLGIKITLYTAGGYNNLGNQRTQLRHLANTDKVDGILLTSVDFTRMDPYVEEVTQAGIPVVALINDIHAPAISAKIFAPFYDIGYKLAEYVLNDSTSDVVKVAIFPGPENSEWATGTYQGFAAAISALTPPGRKIVLQEPLYGDTRPDVQRLRLDTLNAEENRDIDYIIGNAVAAVEAVKYLKENPDIHPGAKILSTYITLTVYDQIQKGFIKAAPSDQTISQCRIALDMMVRILEGQQPGKDLPFLAFPEIPLITRDNIDRFSFQSLFGEKEFTPVVKEFNF